MSKLGLVVLALLLAAGITLGPISAYAASSDTEPMAKYQDFMANAWYAIPMEWSVREGIFTGTSEKALEPDRFITRAEFATVLVKYFGYKDENKNLRFTDVSPEDWFYSYVSIANRAGIASGVSETEFQPKRNITREQAVTMLLNAAKISPQQHRDDRGYTAFPDSGSISEWALPSVRAAVALSLLHGYENGELRPLGYITRAETAQLLYKVHQMRQASGAGGASYRGSVSGGGSGGARGGGSGGSSGSSSGGGAGSGGSGSIQPVNPTPETAAETYALLSPQNGGEEIKVKIVDGHIQAPEEPAKSGLIFGGWYTEEAGGYKFDFEFDTASPDTKLYARWYTPDEWYQIQTMNQAGKTDFRADTDLLATVGTAEIPCSIRYGEANTSPATLSIYLVKSDGENGEKLTELRMEPGFHTSTITVDHLPPFGNYGARMVLTPESGIAANIEATLYVAYAWDRG